MASDPFGVFVLRAGQWALHATYTGISNARDEARYLNDALALTASVFKRKEA